MQALRIAIAVVVTVIWAGTYGRFIVAGGASPPAELSAIMLAVVSAVLGSELADVVRKRKNGAGDG